MNEHALVSEPHPGFKAPPDNGWHCAMQIEQMEEEVRAAKQEAASLVAAARKEAAAVLEEARREAQRHGASTMASAMEREAALSSNLADLRAEYEASPSHATSSSITFCQQPQLRN